MQRIIQAWKFNYIFFILLLWSLNIYFYKPPRDHWNSYLFQFTQKVVPSLPNQIIGELLNTFELRRTSPNSDDFISTPQKSIYVIHDIIFTILNYFNSSKLNLIVIFFIITGILLILANTKFLILIFRYGKEKQSLLIFFSLITTIEIIAHFFNRGQSAWIWNKYINNEVELSTYSSFHLLIEHLKMLIMPSNHFSIFGLEPRSLVLLVFTIYCLEYYILRVNKPWLVIFLPFIHLPTSILIYVILFLDNMIQTKKFNKENYLLMVILANSVLFFLFNERFGIFNDILFIVSNLLIMNITQKSKYSTDLKLSTSFIVWGVSGIIIILLSAISLSNLGQGITTLPYWYSSSLIEASGRYFSIFRIIFFILISTQLFRFLLYTDSRGINLNFTLFNSKINLYFMICVITTFVITIKIFELYLLTK
jgi:hypothetical protein